MRLIDADALKEEFTCKGDEWINNIIDSEHTINAVSVVRCEECRKSHVDGKTTHYLWCTEWGRSTDTFGYCERGEREGE